MTGGQEARTAARVAELNAAFGDPGDPVNPVGHDRLLEADEAGELSAAGEKLLDAFGLNAEFVPTALGGRLERVDSLARVLREVFRRDVALGLGYGVTSFMAAVNVWTGGDERQRTRLAEILLGGGRVSVAYHELAHGNDFLRNEFEARVQPDGSFLLHGAKQVVNNAGRADAWLLFSRTDPAPGPRSHSVLMVERAEVAPERLTVLPRYGTVGVRGCLLSGLDFDRAPVPGRALVGELGHGADLALRSFQLTRSALPGMALGAADTALRTVVSFARGRRLYQRTVDAIPQARATLGDAFLDLLISDCLCLAGTRSVHLLPDEASVYASAVKYLVPALLQGAMHDLSIVLGARFYLRQGEFGIFQKHLRDLPVLSLGHAGAAACQATIIPQLPRLARRSWFRGEAAPGALFDPRGDLPETPFGRLALTGDRDGLSASLVAAADTAPDGSPQEAAVRALARQLTGELRLIQQESLALPPQDRTALASPAAFALADRYAVLLAGAAVLGVWRRAGDRGDDPFLADPAWAAAALHRLVRRLGRRPADLPAGCVGRVQEELLRRHAERRSFDLYDTALAG
ncbi:acyl-CoA dehydrogenase [Actinacidiphila paucisporea]|uniref:Acyl-CoA dehydrogenase n=1 Tax=Actinacidiphila paucisporea TaxID=310782 RepID=A0A1M7PLD9_9ACTN|nr:acyl-CoA dehydrogenase [Actinacidiphila paucisporea]SHN17950.1 Acyl-CoA dehydrogenase [Actinacidiphila paucisporea]